MEQFLSDTHPKNKLVLFLGNKTTDTFDINLDESLQESMVAFLKPAAIKQQHTQCKYYYLNDLKYIITQSGYHRCMKSKIHKYNTTKNLMLCSLQEITLPIDVFPPVTGYHDTRIIERSVFSFNAFSLEVLSVLSNGNVTYECIITITSGKWNDTLLQDFLKKFSFDTTFNQESVYLEHGESSVVSII